MGKTIKDFLATVIPVIAIIYSVLTLGYYIWDRINVIEITLSFLSGLVGFLFCVLIYLLLQTRERARTVFLSYRSFDKGLAEKIEHDLQRDGFHVFNITSTATVGESITKRIEAAMSIQCVDPGGVRKLAHIQMD